MAHRAFLSRVGAPLLACALMAGCTSAGSTGATGGKPGGAVQVTGALPPPSVLASTPNASQAEYRIGPLDLLEISVFQVPDLSKTVKVSATGEIAMPLIGVIHAGGKTVSQVEEQIKAGLDAQYTQSAQVSVFVKEANSQQVTVDGAVNKPGMIALTGPTTLMETIALSGGLAPGAKPRGIVVFRNVDQKRLVAKFDLVAIRNGQADDPPLYGGDKVVVDSSSLSSAFKGIRDSIPAFAVFTPLLL